jgi:hypothetical protein
MMAIRQNRTVKTTQPLGRHAQSHPKVVYKEPDITELAWQMSFLNKSAVHFSFI